MRGILAIVLLIGFYAVALATAAVLLYIPYAEVVYARRIHFQLAVGCVVGALAILFSVIPRPDRFVAPGPRLSAESQPRLFALLRGIAEAINQRMPAEVYLVPDVNAWVAQRGGLMGIGSRRVMGLGLPLLQTLRASQLRAVLAHEFGHYHGGDTRLGPWIHKTRSAIVRTLENLGDNLVRHVFEGYMWIFLRITQRISRQQEYAADRLAAGLAGRSALVTALEQLHGVGAAFAVYWSEELLPILNRGFRPPVAAGFARFLAAPGHDDAMRRTVARALRERPSDTRFDSHPPLADRMAALEGLPDAGAQGEDPLAIELLDNVAELERGLFSALEGDAPDLEAIRWEECAERIWVPAWMAHVRAHVTASLRFDALADALADLPNLAERLGVAGGRLNPQSDEAVARWSEPSERRSRWRSVAPAGRFAARLASRSPSAVARRRWTRGISSGA